MYLASKLLCLRILHILYRMEEEISQFNGNNLKSNQIVKKIKNTI